MVTAFRKIASNPLPGALYQYKPKCKYSRVVRQKRDGTTLILITAELPVELIVLAYVN
jgi:hypothetical protein